MTADLRDLTAFAAVARAGGFRDAARASGSSASSLSEAVRRLEARFGVRLLNRTTRSVAPTEAGARLLDRLGPALREVEAALDVVNGFRDRPAGTLRLNVPVAAARLILPRLEQDMIAIPIGPRDQRFATAASPAYLDRRGRPDHPRDLLDHACLRGRFTSGAMTAWEFERDGEVVKLEPSGPLIVRVGAATDLAVDAAVAGSGVIQLFEEWLRPYLDSGALEAVLEPWWQRFSGPFLYYPGRRYLPAPLRAFVDFISSQRTWS
jgi:DNA-binding transcriptional LysR family regulator